MDKLKTYGEIYDEEFLKKFGKYRDDVAKTKLEKEFEVDVKKIAELCNIEVIEEYLDVIEYPNEDEMDACKMMHSAPIVDFIEYVTDVENRKVKINSNRTEEVKRFNLAHEIGHILIGNLKIAENAKNNSFNKNLIKRLNEFNSSYFANELLLPKVLLKRALEDVMREYKYDPLQKFSENDVNLLTDKTANLLNVPRELLRRRIDRLNVFN